MTLSVAFLSMKKEYITPLIKSYELICTSALTLSLTGGTETLEKNLENPVLEDKEEW